MYSLLMATGNFGCVVGSLIIGLAAETWGLRMGMAAFAIVPIIAIFIIVKIFTYHV